MKFDAKLRKLLDAQGLSQSELAAAIGLQPSRVSRWARGEGEPTRVQLVRLARALGVTADFLADDAQDEPDPGPSPAEARVLEAARVVGYDLALRRIMAAPESQAPPGESYRERRARGEG